MRDQALEFVAPELLGDRAVAEAAGRSPEFASEVRPGAEEQLARADWTETVQSTMVWSWSERVSHGLLGYKRYLQRGFRR